MIERTIVESIEYTINETRYYLLDRLPDNSESTWKRMKWSATNPIRVLLASLYTSQQIATEQCNHLEKLINELENMTYRGNGGLKND